MPYERFLTHGAESLTNAELLAVILRTGTRNCSATELAGQILGCREKKNTSLRVLFDIGYEDLVGIDGIGEVKAVKILCLAELFRRIGQDTAKEKLSFSDPSTVADYYMETLRHKNQEHSLLLMLDNKLSLIREEVLSIGTVNLTVLSPRDIYMKALHAGAVRILLVHNHPSGDPTPSRQDIEVTKRIRDAGELLDVLLVDHLIIGDGKYTSLKETGYLE